MRRTKIRILKRDFLSIRLTRVLFVQPCAYGYGAVRIYGAVALFNVLDFPLFVHDYRGPLRPLEFVTLDVIGLQNLIRREDFFVHVAEKRERNPNLLCKSGVGCGTVNANSQDDCVARFELGQISLIGLEFFRSTTRESQHVKRQNDVLLPAKVA
jgi:hypothetical protein